MNNPSFGKIFEEARLKMGFSKVQLSRALKVTEASIYRYEKGEVPTPNILKRIEKVMDLEFNLNELKQRKPPFEKLEELLVYLEENYPSAFKEFKSLTPTSSIDHVFDFLSDNSIEAQFGLSNESNKNYSGTYFVTIRLKKKNLRDQLGRKRNDISYYKIYSETEAKIKAVDKGFKILEMIKTGNKFSIS